MKGVLVNKKTPFLFTITFIIMITLVDAPGSEGMPSHELARDKQNLIALLPKETEVAGWKTTSKPEFFEPETLWKYINGQAEMYLDYGFKLLVTMDYKSINGSSPVTIEIYRMESPDHSFGIYAAERSPDDHFIKIGIEGYLGEGVLNFWKGIYYVKLGSFKASPVTKEILQKFAEIIANKIRGSYSEPELFACFPQENRVKMSERFIPKNFLGQPFLKNGYRVEYKKGESSYQLFLAKNSSREEAEEAFGKYEKFLKSQNLKMSSARKGDYQLISTEGEVIFQYGSIVGGIIDSGSVSERDRIIEEMVHRLRNRNL